MDDLPADNGDEQVEEGNIRSGESPHSSHDLGRSRGQDHRDSQPRGRDIPYCEQCRGVGGGAEGERDPSSDSAVAATRNARIAALVAIAATLALATTAGNAAPMVAAETPKSNVCAAVAGTAGGGAGAAVVTKARNAAATETTVETARNVAVAATATTGAARNAVAAADILDGKERRRHRRYDSSQGSAPHERFYCTEKGRSEEHQ